MVKEDVIIADSGADAIPVDVNPKGTGVVDGKKVIPDIVASVPFEVPAVEAVTYDKWWISRLIIMGGRPSEPVAMQVSFVRAFSDKEGNLFTTPNQEVEASLRVDSLLDEAAKDSELGDIVQQLLDKVQALGFERGVL